MAGLSEDFRIVKDLPLDKHLNTQLSSLRKSLEEIEQAYNLGQDAASEVEQTPDPAIQDSG